MTSVTVDLIKDVDIHQFIQKDMKGGVSHITPRHSQANNKYIELNDKYWPSKYIIYKDDNSFERMGNVRILSSKLLFTYTDCETNEIKVHDVYGDINKDKEKFIFNKYLENSKFSGKANKKATGKMKEETKGVPIIEAVVYEVQNIFIHQRR